MFAGPYVTCTSTSVPESAGFRNSSLYSTPPFGSAQQEEQTSFFHFMFKRRLAVFKRRLGKIEQGRGGAGPGEQALLSTR